MNTTIKIIIAIAATALLLGTGTASAAKSPSALELSTHPGQTHDRPDGPKANRVSSGTPVASKAKSRRVRFASQSSVSGYITSNGGPSFGGASVSIQYWNSNNSSWVTLASTRSASNGYYSFTMTPGYYYRISAAKIINLCTGGISGTYARYEGTSGYIWAASGRSYTVSVWMRNTSFRFC